MFQYRDSKTTRIKRAVSGILTAAVLLSPLRLPAVYAASSSAAVSANVILREEKSTSSKALATIREGKSVEILSTDDTWVKVKTGSLTGYVYAKYLTSTASTASSVSSSSSLKKGDEGQDVKDMQRALIALGYLSADATGTFGSATREAVEKFQKAEGLNADGIAGQKTLARLNERLAKKEEKEDDGKSAVSASSLRKGNEGAEVTKLQQLLKSAGYFSGECTGYFGSQTEKSLVDFQNAKGLKADGIAGAKTLALLNQTGSGEETVAVPQSGVLREGDEGDAVTALQKLLIKKGYLATEATGFFGSATYKAVMQFQKEMNLKADGIAGLETIEKLRGSASAGQSGVTVSTEASLKKGDENDAVKALQQILIQKGYLSTEATGFFGSATESALKKFQSDNGLSADGVAGEATLKALNSKAAQTVSVSGLRKGDESDAVKELQKLLIEAGYLTTEATGFFGSATEIALLKFQQANDLSADGIAGEKTIKLLSGTKGQKDNDKEEESAAKPAPEPSKTNDGVVLEDWWSGYIDSTFRRGETAEVLDIGTGIRFTIARYGGTNHLDAEPLTPEDTDKYLKCFGYVQTWTARPIHITINGVTYAAAMNGMPHGGQRITSNNCNGQFCIHFLNSRTHGGNQVNQDMQKQIMVAYNAAK